MSPKMSFEESHQLATRICEGNRSLLDSFRAECAELFRLQAERKGQSFNRKPPIGIRFQVGSNAMAVCAPRFNYQSKAVLCDSQVLELITQQTVERDGDKFYRPTKRLAFRLSLQGPSLARWFRSTVADDALTLLTGLKRFMESPAAQLEGRTHCAICGRILNDGHSKSRGVGPECIEVVSRWPFYSNHSALPETACS